MSTKGVVDHSFSLEQMMPHAKNVLFAIYNRFGDGVIAAAICREFIEKWSSPDRRFLILTSSQFVPYIELICPQAEVLAFNRKNLLHQIRFFWLRISKYSSFDIGLNPYSYSKASRSIIKKAKSYLSFSNIKDNFQINYYDRVRSYLELPLKGDFQISVKMPDDVSNILLCPESSEKRRSLTPEQCQKVVRELKKRWPLSRILFLSSSNYPKTEGVDLVIKLKQNVSSSKIFLSQLASADLVITVDSGPLHIATVLDKKVLAYFSSAFPATVINKNAKVTVLRDIKLAEKYCEIKDCEEPVCMNELSFYDYSVWQLTKKSRVIETKKCPML